MKVPPLRDRPDDVPLLIASCAQELGHQGSISELFSDKALAEMSHYHWPGNVRELRNTVEVAMALGEESALEGRRAHVELDTAEQAALMAPLMDMPYGDARTQLLEQFEESYLSALLEKAGGNVSKAARIAQMDRSYLTALIKRRGLR